VAVRSFEATSAGTYDLSRAQQVILEDAAQTVIVRQALDDWITRNPCW
jgi:hypothetical protein